ncbi:putative dehydrogenase [Fimbriiglobus ruber]|uniref:Putative dehydrogenase n=2 Tax=Fimbriiglobus ruber TaxID=1908690 RepID=A0A225E4C2_9BACT|nr:putative dehydrogenase [Fimbriiglobus ruber]
MNATITLNDLLKGRGIDLKQVVVMRHRPKEPALNRVLPWLAAEQPELFNAYQRMQNENVEAVLQKVKYVASFIGRSPGKALFVGLYAVDGWSARPTDELHSTPPFAELIKRGMTVDVTRPTHLLFDLTVVPDFYPEWKGRLIIKWPPPERSWWRRAHNKDEMTVLAIREDSALDAAMPPWNEIVMTWDDLGIMPNRWKAAMHEWRGVYYIFDTSDGKGYVGSASGADNLLGRWEGYAASGHGGNVLKRPGRNDSTRERQTALTTTDAPNATGRPAASRTSSCRKAPPVTIRTSSILLALFGALLTCPLLAAADPAVPIKVGVIGLDNYQAVAFTELFHAPKPAENLAGIRVVAAFPAGSPDIEESVRELPKWTDGIKKLGVEIVGSPAEVLKRVDAVMVMSVDGRAHLEQLKAVLKTGKPVYVGRPLAASLADAVEIFRLAREYKTPIFSCSQHRFSPGFIGMRNHEEVGDVMGCDVYGGCPREPHHPDLFWHGVHGVETLYTIMGPGCVSVTRAATDTADVVTGVWKDGRVGTYRAIRKGAVKYSAVVFGSKGVAPAGIYGYAAPINGVVPKGRYMGYEATAVEIARFFKTRTPPVSAEETTELFAFLEAAEESKRLDGAPVKLEAVLARAGKK